MLGHMVRLGCAVELMVKLCGFLHGVSELCEHGLCVVSVSNHLSHESLSLDFDGPVSGAAWGCYQQVNTSEERLICGACCSIGHEWVWACLSAASAFGSEENVSRWSQTAGGLRWSSAEKLWRNVAQILLNFKV